MITVNPDGKIMVRRCLVTLRPFRLFVLGIGFFSLCFLMTSLGGQFSARRPGDSPFTIRTEVLGGPESRGILRKMSDLLELMVKRMDTLARLENGSELHRAAGDQHFAVDRFPPGAGLMERIQAIAQNVSDIAVKVDQILRHSLLLHSKVSEGRRDQCEAPSDPKFPDCSGKVEGCLLVRTSPPSPQPLTLVPAGRGQPQGDGLSAWAVCLAHQPTLPRMIMFQGFQYFLRADKLLITPPAACIPKNSDTHWIS